MSVRESKGDRIISWINSILLVLIAIITIFPIYYVLVVSFTNPVEYVSKGFVLFPKKWSLVSYKYLFGTDAFPQALKNSATLVLLGTPLHLVVTSALAYALSRKRLAGRRVLGTFILITMVVSPGLIPNYLLIRNLGWINSIKALIIPGLTGGWSVILMRSFFESIPESLEEAAVIDGCNDITVWWKIILPLSLPSLAAMGLFSAVGLWNTYFSAVLYMTDHRNYPLQVVLRNMLTQPDLAGNTDFADIKPPTETLKMAAVVITMTPIVMVYPILQKHFAKGVTLGSVKG